MEISEPGDSSTNILESPLQARIVQAPALAKGLVGLRDRDLLREDPRMQRATDRPQATQGVGRAQRAARHSHESEHLPADVLGTHEIQGILEDPTEAPMILRCPEDNPLRPRHVASQPKDPYEVMA